MGCGLRCCVVGGLLHRRHRPPNWICASHSLDKRRCICVDSGRRNLDVYLRSHRLQLAWNQRGDCCCEGRCYLSGSLYLPTSSHRHGRGCDCLVGGVCSAWERARICHRSSRNDRSLGWSGSRHFGELGSRREPSGVGAGFRRDLTCSGHRCARFEGCR